MKSSLKFREERSPLLRAKVPFKLGGIPLSSGIALGTTQDLAIHVRTIFQAGPCLKLAIKPNDPSPLSLILKTGLGLWGSPDATPLTLTAEFHIAPAAKDTSLSLRIQPRVGDFSLRKDVNFEQTNIMIRKDGHVPHFEIKKVAEAAQSNQNGDLSLSTCNTPSKLDISTMSTPHSNGDSKLIPKKVGLHEKERQWSPSVESTNVVIGSNFSFKIEGLDRERKGRKSKVEDLKEHDPELESAGGAGGMVVHVPEEIRHAQPKAELQKPLFSLEGLQTSLQGCTIVAHSSLPMGSHNLLRVRWGVKPPSEILQKWDGSLQSFTFSKLPSLLVDKISFERIHIQPLKPKESSLESSKAYPELGLLPFGLVEESQELAQVADMCYSMKRQLQLMYAENRVLRRAMEEMRSQADYRGGLDQHASLGNALIEEQIVSKRAKEEGNKSGELKKAHVDGPWKGSAAGHADRTSPEALGLSKELQLAIMGAKGGASGGKKD